MHPLTETLCPDAKSWVETANDELTDFPIQNLPYGVFSHDDRKHHIGVAIGDQILDLTALEAQGGLPDFPKVFNSGTMNAFMALGSTAWVEMRRALFAYLVGQNTPPLDAPLIAQSDARMHLPIFVRSFTDFYASRVHATNVGRMFRDPENALLPNWLHMPVGYNGRASTVVVSGTDIHRPLGQLKPSHADAPHFGPSQKIDFEVELGAVVGTKTQMGTRLTTDAAYDAIFGYVLLNDWSARDIQLWEYQPLGPFLSKAFATTISPWIVTSHALEPFRTSVPQRELPVLDYLYESSPNNFDVEIAVDFVSAGHQPTEICRTNARHLYFSAAAQLAHHTTTGCCMEVGDLLGSGTISGPTPESYGSMLELTWNGQSPLSTDAGPRRFLQDGDGIVMRGQCRGSYRMGFGRCTGMILPPL